MGDAEFEKYSHEMQKLYLDLIEDKEYDVLVPGQFNNFIHILRFFIKSEERAKKLNNKIVGSSNLYFRVVLVNCYQDNKFFCYPVLSLRIGHNHIVFYDLECRMYKNWEDFLTNNCLPKCQMKYPKDGLYKRDGGILKLEGKESPACSIKNGICDGLYIAAKVVAILASCAAGSKFLQPYNTAIAVASGISNGYTIGYHASQLFDRAMHDQSISYSDSEAEGHWNSMFKDWVFFGVTVGQIKYGTPQSNEVCIKNLVSLCKIVTDGKDVMSSLGKMQNIILNIHLCNLSPQAAKFVQDNILPSNIELKNLIQMTKMFIHKDNLVREKFRRLVDVDGATIATVANGIAFSREIPRLFQNELYSINIDLSEVVDIIMQEMKSWVTDGITVRQLIFHVYRACSGSKSFETMEEMCEHFHVGKPEDVQRNNKFLFRGPGEKFLNFFQEHGSTNHPELLSYIVDYLEGDNSNDISSFRKYWKERLAKEFIPNRSLQITTSEKHWINAVTLENLSYTCSIPAEGTILVRPGMGNFEEISVDDLYKLAKKLLGRVGDVDVQMARPDLEWVVVASKKCRFTVIIGPKIRVEHHESIIECYPVFKRSFL